LPKAKGGFAPAAYSRCWWMCCPFSYCLSAAALNDFGFHFFKSHHMPFVFELERRINGGDKQIHVLL
jgi:hypothetical protein